VPVVLVPGSGATYDDQVSDSSVTIADAETTGS
jgi:hypothetical protein